MILAITLAKDPITPITRINLQRKRGGDRDGGLNDLASGQQRISPTAHKVLRHFTTAYNLLAPAFQVGAPSVHPYILCMAPSLLSILSFVCKPRALRGRRGRSNHDAKCRCFLVRGLAGTVGSNDIESAALQPSIESIPRLGSRLECSQGGPERGQNPWKSQQCKEMVDYFDWHLFACLISYLLIYQYSDLSTYRKISKQRLKRKVRMGPWGETEQKHCGTESVCASL